MTLPVLHVRLSLPVAEFAVGDLTKSRWAEGSESDDLVVSADWQGLQIFQSSSTTAVDFLNRFDTSVCVRVRLVP